jgi:hypothetical protein
MKIEFDITYDAGKLSKKIPKMVREYLNDGLDSLKKGSKNAIKSGKFAPLGEFTKFARKEGLSPKSNYKKTGSKKPLYYTGDLFRSITSKKRGHELIFNEYGIFHLGIKDASEIDILLDNKKKSVVGKSGTAYKIRANSFTREMQDKFGWKSDRLAGKDVPIRDWLQFDDTIKDIKKDFYKKLDDNFKK